MSARLPVLGRGAPRGGGASAGGAAEVRLRIERPALGIGETHPSARDAVIASAQEALAELTAAAAWPVHVWLSSDGYRGRGLEQRLRAAGAAQVQVQSQVQSELASAARSLADTGGSGVALLVLGAALCHALELPLTVLVGPGSAHHVATADLRLPRDAGPVLRRVAAGLVARLR